MDNDKLTNQENPLAALLADKELLSRLSGVIETMKSQATPPPADTPSPTPTEPADGAQETATSTEPTLSPDALSAVLSNPELMAKLPDVMTALTPVLKGNSPKKAPPDRRTALLLALRPYLSEGRCEAIDYITRIGKLGDVVKNLKL